MLPMPHVATECMMFVHRDANVCDANRASSVHIARPAACCSADSDLFQTPCWCFIIGCVYIIHVYSCRITLVYHMPMEASMWAHGMSCTLRIFNPVRIRFDVHVVCHLNTLQRARLAEAPLRSSFVGEEFTRCGPLK